MATLRVRLFGKFCAYQNEQVVSGLDARKVQELFCYLLLYRNHTHSREALAGLLWGDIPTNQSKKCLRQALWQLQSAVDQQPRSSGIRVLLVEPDWVQLNSEAELWVDVAIFEQTFARVQDVPGEVCDRALVAALRSAVDLYQGDLLEGWYQDWCLYERERLQNMYLTMLDKLMGFCESHNQYETGLVYGARILRHDRARERTHRRLMRLHVLAGDRAAALRQYERCVASLDEELGARPAKSTTGLYEQIRAGQINDGPIAELATMPIVETTALVEVLGRLKQIRVILSAVQHQLQEDIQTVEQALRNQH
jgi:DNA-binding SARP family transcriptional activator